MCSPFLLNKIEYMENAIQQHTVVCDNPTCDYKVVNKTGKVDLEELKKYINKPCPKCSENLLTQKDYDTARRMIKIVLTINKYFGWLFRLFGKSKETKYVSVHVHNGINIENKNK